MMLKAFSLLDIKTGVYSQPFFVAHRAMAVRAVIDLAQDMSNTVGRHPVDFVLYMIGEFDDNTGQIVPCEVENHGSVSAIVAANQKPLHKMTASEVIAVRGEQREISEFDPA